MWHIVVGLAVLSTVFSLVCGGLYKLSGKRRICKRGEWADENDGAASDEKVTEIRKPSVDWMAFQVQGIDVNEITNQVPDVVVQ